MQLLFAFRWTAVGIRWIVVCDHRAGISLGCRFSTDTGCIWTPMGRNKDTAAAAAAAAAAAERLVAVSCEYVIGTRYGVRYMQHVRCSVRFHVGARCECHETQRSCWRWLHNTSYMIRYEGLVAVSCQTEVWTKSSTPPLYAGIPQDHRSRVRESTAGGKDNF